MTAKDINGDEIKVGDTVERVEYSSSCWGATEVGKTYKVVGMGDTFRDGMVLDLDGVEGRYYANKFKVIPSKKIQPFTKSDLKDGMVVTYRNGSDRLVFEQKLHIKSTSDKGTLFVTLALQDFNEDMTLPNYPQEDIVKVEYMDEVLWEREEPLTEEQLRIKELEEGIAKMQEEMKTLLQGE